MQRLVSLLAFICLLNAFPAASGEHPDIRVGASTSTVSSGLKSYLAPRFENETGYKLVIFAVGSGRALRLGREGKVDAVFVHAPAAEKRFLESGYGVNRYKVMHNDFIIVGPTGDPAGIRGLDSAVKALRQIGNTGSNFISRGDDSGTHKREQALWRQAGAEPYGLWYRETGLGMAKTLDAANRTRSDTLIDRGTWLALKKGLSLQVLVEKHASLHNPYSVIPVNPDKVPGADLVKARKFAVWMASGSVQRLIGSYRVNGGTPFTPGNTIH